VERPSSSAVTQPSWQYLPVTHLTLRFSLRLSITGMRSSLEFLNLFVYDSSITCTVSMQTFLMSCFLQMFFHSILAYLTTFLWCASFQTQKWWNIFFLYSYYIAEIALCKLQCLNDGPLFNVSTDYAFLFNGHVLHILFTYPKQHLHQHSRVVCTSLFQLNPDTMFNLFRHPYWCELSCTHTRLPIHSWNSVLDISSPSKVLPYSVGLASFEVISAATKEAATVWTQMFDQPVVVNIHPFLHHAMYYFWQCQWPDTQDKLPDVKSTGVAAFLQAHSGGNYLWLVPTVYFLMWWTRSYH